MCTTAGKHKYTREKLYALPGLPIIPSLSTTERHRVLRRRANDEPYKPHPGPVATSRAALNLILLDLRLRFMHDFTNKVGVGTGGDGGGKGGACERVVGDRKEKEDGGGVSFALHLRYLTKPL